MLSTTYIYTIILLLAFSLPQSNAPQKWKETVRNGKLIKIRMPMNAESNTISLRRCIDLEGLWILREVFQENITRKNMASEFYSSTQ